MPRSTFLYIISSEIYYILTIHIILTISYNQYSTWWLVKHYLQSKWWMGLESFCIIGCSYNTSCSIIILSCDLHVPVKIIDIKLNTYVPNMRIRHSYQHWTCTLWSTYRREKHPVSLTQNLLSKKETEILF